MRKADKWGIPDVDALLASISSRQWSEWMMFNKLYPSPEQELNAQLCSLIANCHRDPKKPAFQPKDFLPQDTTKPQSPAEMRARIGMATVGNGKKR